MEKSIDKKINQHYDKDAIKYKKLGFKFLAISLDSIFLIDKAVKTLEEVRKK